MTLGTGIFLASLVLGTIGLYALTRDRWKWRKIAKWGGIGLAAAVLLPTAWFLGWDKVKPLIIPRMPYTEMLDVKLGAPIEDVKFVKGVPTDTCTNASTPGWTALLYRGDGSEEGKVLERVTVMQDHGVWTVLVARVGDSYVASPLEGVSWADSPAIFEKKFGEPNYIEASENGLTRTYYFRKYNLMAAFRKNSAEMIGIYHPERPEADAARPDSVQKCVDANGEPSN
jgi:hypothetical protein